jgi:hypothetical protein
MKTLTLLLFLSAAFINAHPSNKFELNSEKLQRVVEQGRTDLTNLNELKYSRSHFTMLVAPLIFLMYTDKQVYRNNMCHSES